MDQVLNMKIDDRIARFIRAVGTATTRWLSSWPKSTIYGIWGPSTASTGSLPVCSCSDEHRKRLVQWSSKSAPAKWSRSTSAVSKESSPGKEERESICRRQMAGKAGARFKPDRWWPLKPFDRWPSINVGLSVDDVFSGPEIDWLAHETSDFSRLSAHAWWLCIFISVAVRPLCAMNPSKWSATRLESAASHQKARNAAPSSNACRTTERRRSSCAGRTPDACTRSVSISNISVFFFFSFAFTLFPHVAWLRQIPQLYPQR